MHRAHTLTRTPRTHIAHPRSPRLPPSVCSAFTRHRWGSTFGSTAANAPPAQASRQPVAKQHAAKAGISSRGGRRGLSDISNSYAPSAGSSQYGARGKASKCGASKPSKSTYAAVPPAVTASAASSASASAMDPTSHAVATSVAVEVDGLTRQLAATNLKDVDAEDMQDAQAVAEYAKEIHSYFKKVEGNLKPSATYMDDQVHINAKMRAILVDWLVEVHLKFKLSPETLYLTINLIDRFLEKKMVARQRLQLVGVTCMLLASKYEEIYFPEVRDFVYITDRAYTRGQILKMETVVLNTLKFQMTVPTALKFLTRFAKVNSLDKHTELTASYICERTLQEQSMLQYLPSEIAATSISLALRASGQPSWNPTLAAYTGYSAEDLAACNADARVMMTATERPDASLRAVKKKYKQEKYESVSATPLRL